MAVAGGRRVGLIPETWPIAHASRDQLAYLLPIDALALGVVGFVLLRMQSRGSEWLMLGFLAVLALAFEEGVRRAARLQLRLSADLKRDMTSVWAIAGAVALPRWSMSLLLATVLSYVWFRQHRPAGQPLYRKMFNAAVILVSALIASYVVHGFGSTWANLPWALGGALSVLVAIAVYTSANRLLVTPALLVLGARGKALLGSRSDNLIELATLCLGGLVALAILHEPALCVLVIAPMVTLQRGALVRELETAATMDSKTGLLNAVAWEHLAQRELARAEREQYDVAVLIIDIDRFKLVNDRYGHLVGDDVLRNVGKTLAAEVREYDTVGRFGGEEFVAVLPSADDADALVIAERLRSRVNEMRLSSFAPGIDSEGPDDGSLAVSIGVACSSHDGREITALLVAADSALYKAKAGGRNRVVLADRGTGASGRVLSA